MLKRLPHYYEYLYRIDKIKTRVLLWIAHRLPKAVKYWVIIDVAAYYSVQVDPNAIVPEITWDDMLMGLDYE